MKTLLLASAISLFLVTGCASNKAEPSGSERLSQQVARSTLDRAQQAYDEGNYANAVLILRNGASVLEAAEPATRRAAMKLEAFSYCVSNQIAQCEAQFVKLLQVFPSFELTIAERKHPVWGPAFEIAKKARR